MDLALSKETSQYEETKQMDSEDPTAAFDQQSKVANLEIQVRSPSDTTTVKKVSALRSFKVFDFSMGLEHKQEDDKMPSTNVGSKK
jgi:hypothetical protein